LPHLSAAYNLARWLTRNEHDAEDVVQEAYLRALSSFKTFQSGRDGRAWLLAIVRNTCYTWLRKNRPSEMAAQLALAEEAVSSHIRSLMANHLADVASTDQHTVKPWFNGKLDFSPPVKDLAEEGFPLTGGRLDYLEGRPVAGLLHRRNRHIINLFVWPSSRSGSRPEAFSIKGYNVVHWTESGMTFWAVSDLNRKELDQFAQHQRR
jgi:anti-sigma factor RsiW